MNNSPQPSQKPINFHWPECEGVRIENPSAIIPISVDNDETFPKARLWLGTENDHKLLLSSNWLLVDIEDKSRLVYSGGKFFNNFDHRFEEKIDFTPRENVLDISILTEKPCILIPREMAIQIGVSRLTDLGKVTQTNYVSTYTIRKLVQHVTHTDSCILHQNGQSYEIQHFLNSLASPSPNQRQMLPVRHYLAIEAQLTLRRIANAIKLPFVVLYTRKKLLFALFVGRIIFAHICQKFSPYFHHILS